MTKAISFTGVFMFILTGSALFIAAPVFATDEDNAELGIEMKKSQPAVSVADTLKKSNDKLHHYQKAKDSVAQIFTGTPAKPADSKPSSVKKSIEGTANTILLKNGQTLTGVISERDKNGVWIETDPGVKVYFGNNEIKEIK